jgi:hypothetical protein
LTQASLEDAAHHDFVHLIRPGLGAAKRLLQRDGPELDGRDFRQGAEVFADGRARGGKKKCVGHGDSLWRSALRATQFHYNRPRRLPSPASSIKRVVCNGRAEDAK